MWWNWQTRWIQNPVRSNLSVGSIPSAGTNKINNLRSSKPIVFLTVKGAKNRHFQPPTRKVTRKVEPTYYSDVIRIAAFTETLFQRVNPPFLTNRQAPCQTAFTGLALLSTRPAFSVVSQAGLKMSFQRGYNELKRVMNRETFEILMDT